MTTRSRRRRSPHAVRWTLLTTVVMLLTANAAGYFPPGPVEEGFPENLLLVYSGYYSVQRPDFDPAGLALPTNLERVDGGDWLPADFVPYVAHLDWDGVPDDTFFDSFLFLGLRSHRGRAFDGEREQGEAALWFDWRWYLDRIFTPGKQIDALDQTVAAVAEVLGQPDYKVNVYIMIPYPSHKVTDFGHPDGSMGGPSLLPVENRLDMVRWYVDEVVARWQSLQPGRLHLAGFYWLQEHINPAVPDEDVLVRGAVQYVQDKGYKIGWIPWSGAMLATRWADYGFDWAIIQPNHMFRDGPGLIELAVQRGRDARMGIEIELDGRVRQPDGEARLYDYLNGGVRYGYVRDAMLGYYQDLDMLLRLYVEESGKRRYIYDDIYAFAKGSYPEPAPAAAYVQGRVLDGEGRPVAGARVEGGGRTTHTDAEGFFTLTGIYSAQTDIVVAASGLDPLAKEVATSRGGATEPYTFVLYPATELSVHDFDTTDGLAGTGVGMERVQSPRTQGDGAVQLTLQGGLIQSLRITPAPELRDWSRAQVAALDVLVSDPVTVRITLRDRRSASYSRLFELEPGAWRSIMLPIGDLVAGRYHDPIVAGTTGEIDPAAVDLVTLAFVGNAGTQVVVDNLRLQGLDRHRLVDP